MSENLSPAVYVPRRKRPLMTPEARAKSRTEAHQRAVERCRQKVNSERERCKLALLDCFAAIDQFMEDREHLASAAEVMGRSHVRRVCNMRRAIAYTLKRREGWDFSNPVIGHVMGRDHTSIIYLVQSAEACLDRCANPYCVKTIKIINALNAGLDAREGRG